ncbi:MAG: hypothetical protein QOH25_937 [Acidobacteriota bacterium]|nr:hypothetical protein [Acidobacteriota bacterium]
MTSSRQLISLGCLLTLCLMLMSCKGDRFVGNWKPVETSGTDNDHMRIDTFNLNKDGTFSIKYKDASRKEVSGTYTKAGDKIELSGPTSRKKVEGSIGSDGRLGISEGGGPVLYFVKS